MKRLFLIVSVALALSATTASAQFYKPVVRLMGTITEKSGKPIVARVSVRDASDTTREIVGSNSNSSTGKYLAIVKPSQRYVVVVRADSMQPQSVRISTPVADHNTEVVQDFQMQPVEPVHKKATKAAKAQKPKKAARKKR